MSVSVPLHQYTCVDLVLRSRVSILSFVSYSMLVPWHRLVALLLFHTLVGTFSLVLMPINLVWILSRNSSKYLHVLSSGWLESQTT